MSDRLAGIAIVDGRGGALLPVLVQPRAPRDRLAGVHGDRVKVQVKAPPVDGAANAALVRLLARALGLPKTACSVAKGATSRRKLVHVEGLSAQELARRLDAALGA